MILFVALVLAIVVVVIVGAAGAGMFGVGVLSEDHRRGRLGLLAALSAPVILGVGVALLAVLVLGLGRLTTEDGDTTRAAPTTAPRRPATDPTLPLPSAGVESGTARLPVVLIERADENHFSAYRPVSGLPPGSAVRVQADGFASFERGRVEQCVRELGRQTACGETFPVQFDEGGRADFQFALRDDFAPGRCRAGQPTCLLRLTGTHSGRYGTVQIVLVDQLTAGRVQVRPDRRLAERQTVEVSVTGFLPGATATAVLCAPPEPYDARRCAAPGPTAAFAIDASGSGHTTIVIAAGRLGPAAALCGPRRPCGVAVVVGPGFITAPAVPVAFSLGPGVAYQAGRLTVGVAVALALVAVAITIAARTDWTKPTEAATPALDRADLRTDRNLDALFGTDEELDERDPVPW